MGKIAELDDATFDIEVKKNRLTIVDFWAQWCGPCQFMAPVLEGLAKEYDPDDRIKMFKLNVDDYPQIAAKYNVMSVPTLIFFREEKILEELIGVQHKDHLLKFIKKHI